MFEKRAHRTHKQFLGDIFFALLIVHFLLDSKDLPCAAKVTAAVLHSLLSG